VKIAILTPTLFRFSGIDRVVERQAEEFAGSGNEVAIFTFEADLAPNSNISLNIIGMPGSLFLQRIYRLFFPLDIVKTIKWLPRFRQFDVVYSHQYPMNWLAYLVKRRYKTKYIYFDYGIADPDAFSNIFERVYIKLISLFTFWTIRNADEAVSISKYLQGELRKHVRLKGRVEYPRIDAEHFCSNTGEIVRTKYRIGNAPVILYVGRISPHKGVDLLVEAFKKVEQQLPNARLIVVGKPTFRNYFKALKEMSDKSIIYAGYVPDEDIPSYYAACDVYATATLWEGFNLPLVEAQACGKPVVAFNFGPHPEVVENNNTGILVKLRDIDGMADAIVKILIDVDLQAEMGRNAFRMVREKFT
jgi:glycosyltransferase involved in cell wall biosynthesis